MSTILNSRISAFLEASYGGSVVVTHSHSMSNGSDMVVATSVPIDRSVPALALSYPVSLAPTSTGLWTVFEATTGVDLTITQPGQAAQTIRCDLMVLSGEVVSLSIDNFNNVPVSFRISAVGK